MANKVINLALNFTTQQIEELENNGANPQVLVMNVTDTLGRVWPCQKGLMWVSTNKFNPCPSLEVVMSRDIDNEGLGEKGSIWEVYASKKLIKIKE